jgi:phage terminase large subunit-like protein
MNTSADLSLAAPSVPVPGRAALCRLLAAGIARIQGSAGMVRHAMRHRPARRAWRQDLPWDVGLDRLAEQANPTWVPRGW